MKTYSFKKGSEWIESDYAPYNIAWQPKKRRRWAWLGRVFEWLFFFAGYIAASWAIVTALKTVFPGL